MPSPRPHAPSPDLAPLIPLVRQHARMLRGRLPAGTTTDDLESAGREALVRARRKYEPARGVPFECYARRRVMGAMLDEVRSAARRQTRERPMTTVTAEHKRRSTPLALDLHDAICSLKPRQRAVVEMYFRTGMTLAEIGEQLGTSSARVCQIKRAAIGTLREALA